MILARESFNSYFGLFTYNFIEKPEVLWTGKVDEIRVEISAQGSSDENWLAVMFLYGRDEVHPHDITLAEICRASQEKIDQFKTGDIINVKRGTYLIGTFEVIYLGMSSPPS